MQISKVLLLVLLFASQLHAAGAITQSATGFDTAPTPWQATATLGGASTAGRTLMVTLLCNNTKASCGAFSQSAGENILGGGVCEEIDNGGDWLATYVKGNITGGDTTFTFALAGNAGSYFRVYVVEISGLDTSPCDSAVTLNTANSTTADPFPVPASGTTSTLSTSNSFIWACLHGNGSGPSDLVAINTGYTTQFNNIPNDTQQPGACGYKSVTGTSGVSASFDLNDPETAIGLITVLKEASAGGTTKQRSLLGVGQ